MINCRLYMVLLVISPVFTGCMGQSNTNLSESHPPQLMASPKTETQIDDYVVEIFEDHHGNLWFGTLSKGVGRFDGKSLTWFSTKNGLCENSVVAIAEDTSGNMWLGTHNGLSKYDGKTFTNFTSINGLCDDRVSDLLIDHTGNIWVGTWNGACRFNGISFSNFMLPTPHITLLPYQNTMNWVTEIKEDRQGNIWFGRDGYGVCKYDGKNFTCFTQKDGLASNCVQAIQEDKQGNMWFGSRVVEKDNPDREKRTGTGGLSRYNGKTFTQYPDYEGLNKNDTYAIGADNTGNIWIGANGIGVYRYDGQSFQLYKGTDRMDLTNNYGLQSILGDRNGTLWLGFSGGLFRLKGSSVINITEENITQQ